MTVYPAVTHREEEQHRFELAKTLRKIKPVALQPRVDTSQPSADTTINSASYASVTGIAVTLGAFAPQKVALSFQANVQLVSVGVLTVRILKDSSEIGIFYVPPAMLLEQTTQLFSFTVHSTAVRMAPRTSAAFDVEAKVDPITGGSAGNYTIKDSSVLTYWISPDTKQWRTE